MRIITALWAALIVCLSVLLATIGIPLAAYWLTRGTPAAPIVALIAMPLVCSWSVRALRRLCGRLIPLSSSGNRMFVAGLACMIGCVLTFVFVLTLSNRRYLRGGCRLLVGNYHSGYCGRHILYRTGTTGAPVCSPECSPDSVRLIPPNISGLFRQRCHSCTLHNRRWAEPDRSPHCPTF